ncbi:MAG: O-methyltransferase [Alphaproteobacteria bacterium]|nr:O-methyltransferase [Alphaproteobacteria bacterium]
MFQVLSPLIESFIENQSSQLPQYFKNLDDIGHAHPRAKMQSSYLQAQYLRFFSTLIKPKYVLDIGTFLGMSAMALAEGLDTDGQVNSIELDPQNFTDASKNIQLSPFSSKIYLHLGNALDIIPRLHFSFDIVFIDADKANYINYIKLVLPKLAPKGLIIVDNIFFHGDIFDLNNNQNNVKGIRAFNQFTLQHPDIENITIPIRDGLLLIKKK